MYCPKCGIENTSDVRFCRKCGAELEAVAALLDGRLVVSEPAETKQGLSKPSWERAFVSLFFGVAMMVASFILGIDPNTGVPNPWLALLFLAFPTVGYGIAQIIKVAIAEKEKERNPVTVRSSPTAGISGNAAKKLPESRTDYVSPEDRANHRTADLVPSSVVEGTTRHLEMEETIETQDLPEQRSDGD